MKIINFILQAKGICLEELLFRLYEVISFWATSYRRGGLKVLTHKPRNVLQPSYKLSYSLFALHSCRPKDSALEVQRNESILFH